MEATVEYIIKHGNSFSNETEGALDLTECPEYPKHRCLCGICTVCGLHKHCAIHGPCYGEPVGSKPWAHKYREASTTEG
jgi:hypothetical protein